MKYLTIFLAVAVIAVFVYSFLHIKKELPVEPTFTTEKYATDTEIKPKEWPCDPKVQKC